MTYSDWKFAEDGRIRGYVFKRSWLSPFRVGMPFVRVWLFWACIAGLIATLSTFTEHYLLTQYGTGFPVQYKPSFTRDRLIDLRLFGLVLTTFCFAMAWANILINGESPRGWWPTLDRTSLFRATILAAIPVIIPSSVTLLAASTGSNQAGEGIARHLALVLSLMTSCILLFSIPSSTLGERRVFRNSILAFKKKAHWIIFSLIQFALVGFFIGCIEDSLFGESSVEWATNTEIGLVPMLIYDILFSLGYLFSWSISISTISFCYSSYIAKIGAESSKI